MNRRLDKMPPSASVQLMARAKEMQKTDPSVISLAGGEPDFDTPDRISMAAIRSLANGNTHYAVGPGIPQLRQAIQNKLLVENDIQCNENHILVTPGGKSAIYLAVQAVLNEGDEVILFTPAWVSYEPIVLAAGGIVVPVHLSYENNYVITKELLENAYSSRTKLIIINYPNNPTGRILHKEEADILEAFLKKHPDVYLLSDEIYEALTYDGNKSISMASRPSIQDQVITVNGLSKSVAMTGWRVGYMASNEAVFKAAYKLYQHCVTCVSSFIQVGAVEAFSCQDEINAMLNIYRERRDMFIAALNSIPGVQCSLPEGAFYAWVNFDGIGMTSAAMGEYLLERAKVVGVPGVAYGKDDHCMLRFSFATATEDLRIAAKRIKEAIEALA